MTDSHWKWMWLAFVAVFALGMVGMYLDGQDRRAREHEAHLERMEMLKLGIRCDGGTP